MIRPLFIFKLSILFAATSFGQTKYSATIIAKEPSSQIEYISEPSFTSSNLPILVIVTDRGKNIPDDPKISAHMGIIDNGPGKRNKITDSYNHYDGKIGIELRGNSTQEFPKKPYNFETRNSDETNLDVSLLGMPEESDWVLSASYLDHTFIRNQLASHLSQLMGRWASRSRMVEVVLNGKYQGIYILMESIKRVKDRLNIATLAPEEITEPDISGGYIWEITGFDNNLGNSRYLKYPKYNEAAPEQVQYITQCDNKFRNVMNSADYKDEKNGYASLIDVPSFIDEMIVQEAIRNSDAYGWSGYFHKDKGQKINAGPVWDFDQSAGNSSYPDDGVVNGWMFEHQGTGNTPFFWKLLFNDQVYRYKVRLRWEELRKGDYRTENLFTFIDSIANLLSEAQYREFAKWPVLGQNIWRETVGFQNRTTYKAEIDYLTGFLTKRWNWMDSELAKIKNPDPISAIAEYFENSENIHVYPNPATDYLWAEINSEKSGKAFIEIHNCTGNLVQTSAQIILTPGTNNFKLVFDGNMKPGFYLYKVLIDNKTRCIGKLIKKE